MDIIADADPVDSDDNLCCLLVDGYLDPNDYLDDPVDADRVQEAIDTLLEFEEALQEAGLI